MGSVGLTRVLCSFNPHPARRPDASRLGDGALVPWCNVFQSSSSRRPDARTAALADNQRGRGFNPHPARRPDASCPFHHMLNGAIGLFQSSSSPKTGCKPPSPATRRPAACFNPHPARRPDASCALQPRQTRLPWCFNPHPARRPDARSAFGETNLSSTRSFNPHPARRPDASPGPCAASWKLVLFQSSSSPKTGCKLRDRCEIPQLAQDEFQSSSSPKTGCKPGNVSILIQPEDRMLMPDYARFNPHPARRPDASHQPTEKRATVTGFNPHPARRPDASGGQPAIQRNQGYCDVSILIQPEDRMQGPKYEFPMG